MLLNVLEPGFKTLNLFLLLELMKATFNHLPHLLLPLRVECDIVKAFKFTDGLNIGLTLARCDLPLISYRLCRRMFSTGRRCFLGWISRVRRFLMQRNVFKGLRKRKVLDRANPLTPPGIKIVGGVG